ncbi:hypothetical protein WJX81_001104 [Elliptochloris bilobata]|uniref:7,8-dihydroneopterin aldolase n=1 Tax=Elliptochloris bilobata TaxID=381761 RepID=A0AAW1RN67_9CHLO
MASSETEFRHVLSALARRLRGAAAPSAHEPKEGGWDPAAQERLCRAFQAESFEAVQDVLNSLLLAECVYRAYDGGPAAAAAALAELARAFPPGLVTVRWLQCSLPHVPHRYLVAADDGNGALYVALMGTKAARDGCGRRIVFCGHSLGGAVAKLCALRLLRQLPPAAASAGRVRCVAFGAPALGNAALAALVAARRWDRLFYSLTLPEDVAAAPAAPSGCPGMPGTETRLGQRFVVDATLLCDLRAAGRSDDLADTIDYAAVYRHIKEIVEGPPHRLLEAVAEQIASGILQGNARVTGVHISVAKPHVAVGGVVESLGVEVRRWRKPA